MKPNLHSPAPLASLASLASRASLRSLVSLCRLVPVVTLALGVARCVAVYPEFETRTRPVSAERVLDPPPPSDLRWVSFVSAKIPERTRDGRPWQASGKANPYAKLIVNEREMIKTTPESGTLAPTWPKSPHGNFKLEPSDRLRVELWDSNPINDVPIGIKELGRLSDISLIEGRIPVSFEAEGAELIIAVTPAHAIQGLGLWFELRTESCGITRMLGGSPAERAGLLPNDEVVKIGATEVRTMSPEAVRSAFNAVPLSGLVLTVKHSQGAVQTLTVKEGPIYPTFDQYGPID